MKNICYKCKNLYDYHEEEVKVCSYSDSEEIGCSKFEFMKACAYCVHQDKFCDNQCKNCGKEAKNFEPDYFYLGGLILGKYGAKNVAKFLSQSAYALFMRAEDYGKSLGVEEYKHLIKAYTEVYLMCDELNVRIDHEEMMEMRKKYIEYCEKVKEEK